MADPINLAPDQWSWLLSTAYAADDDPTMPVLSCVRLVVTGGKAWAVATDRYVMAVATLPVEDVADLDILIPTRTAKALHRATRARRDKRLAAVELLTDRSRPLLIGTTAAGDVATIGAVSEVPLWQYPDIGHLLSDVEPAAPPNGTWLAHPPVMDKASAVLGGAGGVLPVAWTATRRTSPDVGRDTYTKSLLGRVTNSEGWHLSVLAMLVMPNPTEPVDDRETRLAAAQTSCALLPAPPARPEPDGEVSGG